jgi:hypothetical protein
MFLQEAVLYWNILKEKYCLELEHWNNKRLVFNVNKIMIKNVVFILLLAALTMCGNNASNKQMAPEVAGNVPSSKLASFSPTESPTATVERKLIRNGDLSFETKDVKKTQIAIENICKGLNAYISTENQSNYGERLQYNQTIRVPSNLFDSLISGIETNALKVENKNINTQDVTEEFIDVEARLKTKKDLENRYREILKQAKTVQDIVSIEGQIASVRSEIESMEGRLNYLKNQVSFSTLNVSYYQIVGTDFGFASKFVDALGKGWDNLLSFLIVLMNLWPFILLISAITWGVNRWRASKKTQSTS